MSTNLQTITCTKLPSNKMIIYYNFEGNMPVKRVRRSERGKRVAKALAFAAGVWKLPERDTSRGGKGPGRKRAGSRKEKGV